MCDLQHNQYVQTDWTKVRVVYGDRDDSKVASTVILYSFFQGKQTRDVITSIHRGRGATSGCRDEHLRSMAHPDRSTVEALVIRHRISSREGRSTLDHRQFNTRRAYDDTLTKWSFHSSSSTSRSPSIPTPSPASMHSSSLPSCSHSGASRSDPYHRVPRWVSYRLSRVAAVWEALIQP